MSRTEVYDNKDTQSFANTPPPYSAYEHPTSTVSPPTTSAPSKSGPRTLHIYRDSVMNTDECYTIKDSDEQTEIYVALISALQRPQIQIWDAAEYRKKGRGDAPITALLHHTNSEIECHVRGKKFYLVDNSWIRQKYEWPSEPFGNSMLKWKRDFDSWSRQCFADNDKKTVLARWVSAGWSPGKVAEMQIVTDRVPTGAGSGALEELIVTALADKQADNKFSSA